MRSKLRQYWISPSLLSFLSVILFLLSAIFVESFSTPSAVRKNTIGVNYNNNFASKALAPRYPHTMLSSIPVRAEVFFNTKKKQSRDRNDDVNDNDNDNDDYGGIADRIRLFQQYGINSFSIVNKDKNAKDFMAKWIETIRAASSVGNSNISGNTPIDICAQYSLQHNKPPKTRNLPKQRTEFLLETLREGGYLGQADEISLLSGSGPKPKQKPSRLHASWNTVHALEAIHEKCCDNSTAKDGGETIRIPRLAVSYNPYLPTEQAQELENARLRDHLATGCLSKIYFPFGTDLNRLRTGLEVCASAIATSATDDGRRVSLSGSFVVPTPSWRARHQTTVWKGIPLGPEFGSSADHALAIVVQVLKLYRAHGVEELVWEASPAGNTGSAAADLLFWSQLWKRVVSVRGAEEAEDSDASQDHFQPTENIEGSDHETSRNSNSLGEEVEHQTIPVSNDESTDDPNRAVADRSRNVDVDVDGTGILVFGSHDVRLRDNRALEDAMRRHGRVLPVFLWTQDEREGDQWGCPTNTAAAVCLEDALRSLQETLNSFGLPLVYCFCGDHGHRHDYNQRGNRDGDNSGTEESRASPPSRHGATELTHLIEAVGATDVYWNKDPTPEGRARDAYRKDAVLNLNLRPEPPATNGKKRAVRVHETQSSLLYDVDRIELSTGFHGGHFGTLMPFLNQCKRSFGLPPRPTPYFETFRLLEETSPPDGFDVGGSGLGDIDMGNSGSGSKISTNLGDLKIIDIRGTQRWDEPIRKRFPISEQTAQDAMEHFVRKGMKRYEKDRSRADISDATSQLSPHLRIGTLSPNQLYWRIEDSGLPYQDTKTLGRRLIWRDLAYYHLFVFPDMKTTCIRKHYEAMEWVSSDEENRRFRAWKTGRTGYPIVDAAMRELYATGWMTQSIRMVAASFLVEYLRVNWTKGCEWFHYTLVDADSAINAMMWQNAGRSGIDQWNFVLSPKTASQDPTGAYTRRWVPELSKLPTANLVHRPWEGTPDVLEEHGVVLGETYPHRIVVDLKHERQQSIESTLTVRRMAQDYNTDRGYDLVDLPNGQKTIVFTKKEYRIDRDGNVLPASSSSGSSGSNRPASKSNGRGRKKPKRKPKKPKTS